MSFANESNARPPAGGPSKPNCYFRSLEGFDMRLAKPEARSLRLNG